MNKVTAILAVLCAAALSGCNGMFDSIYDDDRSADLASNEYGFQSEATSSTPGKIYVDATDYAKWVYLDFATLSMDTLAVDEPAPKSWDIALHRYEAKTNGGAVREEGTEAYTADVWTTDRIITDMSGMMMGHIDYCESFCNEVLSSWLDVDKSTMPPVYTMSGKTYFVKTADGREYALKLANFMNPDGVKGYLTIEYRPL